MLLIHNPSFNLFSHDEILVKLSYYNLYYEFCTSKHNEKAAFVILSNF